MRREDAVIHVELRVDRAASVGRPPVLAHDGGAATDAADATSASPGLPQAGGEDRVWTVSLVLN